MSDNFLNFEANFNRVRTLLQENKEEQAIKVLHKGIILHQKESILYTIWGYVLLVQGKSTEAIQKFRKAIQMNKRENFAYCIPGDIYVIMKENSKTR